MVINEKTLLKMMQKAYKGGGYHVMFDSRAGRRIMISNYGYAWGVVIERMHMPWSVLGLIVKHIGKIPEEEEAYLVNKDAVQEEVFDVAAKPMDNIMSQAKVSVAPALKRTQLVFDGRNVWQRSNDLSVILVNPEYEDIAVLIEAQPFMVDQCLYARGRHSQVFIARIQPGEHEHERIDLLGQLRWT